MADNIIDFRSQRDAQVQKRKEARVEALKRAFRLARGEKPNSKTQRKRKGRPRPVK